MAKVKKEEFKYEAPKALETKKGVLGTLVGPCADIINPTRNGRKYDEGVWDKAFNNEIVKEYFEAGGIFGELGHPADRSETDPEKIAICMPEPPKKNDKGLLIGRWDILDTPNGRILKTLVDYGYKIGISSRGNGEVYEDLDGQEHVDEDTYDFQAFDAVLLPAVKAARLDLVKESLETKKTLKQALTESYNKASADDKKVMLETLDRLNIKLNEEKEETSADDLEEISDVIDIEIPLEEPKEGNAEEEIPEEDIEEKEEEMSYEERVQEFIAQLPELLGLEELSDEQHSELFDLFIDCFPEEEMGGNKEESSDDEEPAEVDAEEVEEKDEEKEAEDSGADSVVENLQQTLKANASLNAKILDIQNKLAVSDTKVSTLSEELSRYKAISNRFGALLKEKKDLVLHVQELEEKLSNSDKELSQLKEQLTSKAEKRSTLEESIKAQKANVTTLNKKLSDQQSIYENKIKGLNESINNIKKDSEIKQQNLQTKLDKTNKLVEQYKSLALDTVQRYIDSKAVMLGVSSNEITNRLSESYSIDDIDRICESLQEYNLNISRLPFQVNQNQKPKVKFIESKNDNLRLKSSNDDDIDKSLLRLAGLDK